MSSGAGMNFKLDIASLTRDLNERMKVYQKWIARNPGRATDVESFIKVVAYLLPGRIRGTSTILPELIYSTANCLSFWHDIILETALEAAAQRARAERAPAPGDQRNGNIPGPSHAHVQNIQVPEESRKRQIFKIQVALTILEYFEVFLEVAAKKMWGDAGRWIMITLMQTVKAGFRAVLLFHYQIGLIRSPAIPPFDRIRNQPNRPAAENNVAFVLKHSGRVIRKLNASPPMHSRDWNVPEIPLPHLSRRELTRDQLIAEAIHLARPLSHLACMGLCGKTSWTPWLVSLGMDMGSIYLHGDFTNAPTNDRMELRKRTYALLLYLLRSPFYDRATKARLIGSLEALGKRVPLFGNIFILLAHAIPQWQSTYSYVWNDF